MSGEREATTEAQRRAHLAVESAEDVADMGRRVVSNGAEIHYASEKLGLALFKAAEGLTLCGASLDALVERVQKGYRRGRWLGWDEGD